MITHFEAATALLSAIIGMLATILVLVWKGRGWVDRRIATENRLAEAIEGLTNTQRELHAANQQRFLAIERRLAANGRRR